ncbi:MAG: 4Fe-4S ferredoxin [Leptolyngbya foveolarum]|uniref:4Fe-4S ferredoxin n=1 Tax=Leptolyngbya foveolarum TaxID=47253 RepID=A0A2W4URS8_9CYAN|nr:MAG: 4Fe-4S ferredoxin [Leptolyngbya foveolarum]
MICGASYQSLPAVRNLALAYALAGADCIDVAADPAVVAAAKEGLSAATQLASTGDFSDLSRPWLMVSMSAGEDPHFRKAWFDPAICPADCPRPCERICPAAAINMSGVVRDRCYGCGRCLPVCPLGLIEARSHPTTIDAIAQQTLAQVDALEIHTHVGQLDEFAQLWDKIEPWTRHLKLISVSCPDGEGYLEFGRSLQKIIRANISDIRPLVMWQTDGRPMSGDIGKGTTHAAIALAQKVLNSDIEGYVQLAGGTNQYTVPKLNALGLLHSRPYVCPPNRPLGEKADSFVEIARSRKVSGIAYGSFARSLLIPTIEQTLYLEEVPQQLRTAVDLAKSLVDPLKRSAFSG